MEKRWPPERLKSLETPRLRIAWATSRPPWTAVFSSTWSGVAIAARLQLVELPARGVGVELGGMDPPLGLLHLPAGAVERRALPLQLHLGGGQLALSGLAALGPLLARPALGRLAVGALLPPSRGGRGRRTDQPDRRRPLLAGEAAELDRLGDLGIAGGGPERLADAGQDLLPHPVLVPDCLGRSQQR